MSIILYFGILISLVAIDAVWLFSMGAQYKKWLSPLFDFSFTLTPTIIFYLLYALGVLVFVINPAIQKGSSWLSVLLTGALFGAIGYSVYDLTNQATIRHWPLAVTLVDIAWGAALTGISSCLVYLIYTHFK